MYAKSSLGEMMFNDVLNALMGQNEKGVKYCLTSFKNGPYLTERRGLTHHRVAISKLLVKTPHTTTENYLTWLVRVNGYTYTFG